MRNCASSGVYLYVVCYFMQTIITLDISRLSLHDSSFKEIIRHDQDLDLTFDWSKLDNFKEQDINEAIIIGKTKMRFTGVYSEQFKIYDNNDNTKFLLQELPDGYVTETEVIGTTSINDDTKTITFGRLHKDNGAYHWTEWSFKFGRCVVSWTSFVTYTEWQNGKLPID